jgi:hypothetical protein
VSSADTHRIIDAVWGIGSPRLIAGLACIVLDVGVAEQLALGRARHRSGGAIEGTYGDLGRRKIWRFALTPKAWSGSVG